MNIQEYQALKSLIDHTQRDADRANGALDQLKSRLRNDFNCDSIEAAREMLNQSKTELDELEEKYDRLLAEFNENYAGEISEAV